MKILRYYDDIFQAQADCQYLVSQGVPAEVFNENTGLVIPITYANPTMRPYIGVGDEFYDRAAELIEPEPVPQSVCPGCGSGEITLGFPARDKKTSRIMRAVMLPIMILSSHIGNIRRVWHCRACGKEFRT
ncbi:MAG: hypothetical protein LIO77_09820 [Rikenellaceae bacterium]|nr:hypothetical protein [Rikenellaceae bacterium]